MTSPLEDNPPDLDERAEIADLVRERGHDPMDIGKDEQVLEANAILHDWADDPPDQRGGRTDRIVALEWERVEDRAEERGLDLSRPEELDVDSQFLDGF